MSIEKENKITSREKAFREIERAFRGNTTYISNCKLLIASAPNFNELEIGSNEKNALNWEKHFVVTIWHGKHNFKQLHYRKGNKTCSVTSGIHEFSLVCCEDGNVNEIIWEAE